MCEFSQASKILDPEAKLLKSPILHGSPGGRAVKNLPAGAGDAGGGEFSPWVRKISWSKKWQPTPVFLPEKFHGKRSLGEYSPWGSRESNMTEYVHKCTHIYTTFY